MQCSISWAIPFFVKHELLGFLKQIVAAIIVSYLSKGTEKGKEKAFTEDHIERYVKLLDLSWMFKDD